MPFCPKCSRHVCNPCIPAANDNNRRTIVIPSDNELSHPANVQALASVTLSYGLSRRPFLDFLADTIFWFTGEIVWSDGQPFEVTDTLIDDAFPDGDARWLSDFWKFADRAPLQRTHAKVLGRHRIMRIAAEIKDPDAGDRFRLNGRG